MVPRDQGQGIDGPVMEDISDHWVIGDDKAFVKSAARNVKHDTFSHVKVNDLARELTWDVVRRLENMANVFWVNNKISNFIFLYCRYKFLTDKPASCEDENRFSQKFIEERENKDKLQPHHIIPVKSQSAMEFSYPSSSFSGKLPHFFR